MTRDTAAPRDPARGLPAATSRVARPLARRRLRTSARLVALDPSSAVTLRAVAVLAALSGLARLAGVVVLAGAVARLPAGDAGPRAATFIMAGVLVLVAAGTSAVARLVAQAGTTRCKSRLRDSVVATAAGHGSPADARLIGLLTGGLERIDDFVAGQWSAKVRAACVPLAAIAALVVVDWRAALAALALLPAAPILAWLIGARTAAQVLQTWRAAGRLGGTFLDSVAGVMTLKLYGHPEERASRIEAASEAHRRLTLSVLRTAVLSSTATGLVSTMAVGLVAVFCGTRLVTGELSLATALTAILLVPEIYKAPLEVAASFHAESEVAAVLDDLEALIRPQPHRDACSRDALLEDVTVVYADRNVPALCRVSRRFVPGTVTVIRGPSGCGKSTLLRVLAGVLPPSSGRVARPATVGYLPQQARFPQARTVRDAVRGGRPELGDPDVAAALRLACVDSLVTDVPEGLDRALGALDTALSTGQSQLVGLARAYASASHHGALLVLDEPTAHLDPATERRVLTALVERARELQLVVVMAAHRQAAIAAADASVELPASPPNPPGVEGRRLVEEGTGALESAWPAPDEGPGHGPRWWLPHAAVLCGVLSDLCGLGLTATATALLVRAAERPPLLSLTVYFVAVRAFALGRPALRYCERLLAHDAAFRELTSRRMQTWALLVPRIPGRGLPARGELLTRIARDADDEVDGAIRGIHAGLVLAVTVTLAVAGLAALSPPAAVVAGCCGLAITAGLWIVDRGVAARQVREQQRCRGGRDAAVVDACLSLDDLVGNGGSAAAAAVLRPSSIALDEITRRAARSDLVTDGLVIAAAGLLPFVALWATQAVDGSWSPAAAAAAVLVTAAMAELLSAAPQVARAIRLRAESRARREVIAGVPTSPVDPYISAVAPLQPSLNFESVGASWGEADDRVLKKVTLSLPPGRRVAVTGPTGSGKSTLAAVAAHLLEPRTGRVLLDDVDYQLLSGTAVRQRVAVVGLADHVFADTVRGNLNLGDAYNSNQLVDALDRVRLGAWLLTLPDGLDTFLGSGGTTLSGGEQRRLALARALLRGPSLLVLDEPVEGLDSPTAQGLLKDLSDRDPVLSWLLLAHRPEGLDLVQEIRHLKDGSLAHPTWP